MILWLNPVSGISGDMLLGALVDLGARLDDIRAAVSATGIDGSSLEVERVSVHGLNAASVQVAVEEDTTVRTVAEVFEMIDRVTPRPVAELAGRAMHAIAEVESGVHGVPLDELHLHELGSDDTVVDLVGVAAALHILGVEQVLSTPVRLGSGVVNSQHGRLPAPAPATLALLEGMTVESCSISGETVTPTGAALLRAVGCRFGDTPSMVVHKTGYGAGTSRFPNVPNVLVATLCSPATAETDFYCSR